MLSSTSLCQNPLQEFDTTLERLFTFASWADKFDGVVHQAPIRANTIALNEPVGVMGIICPDLAPLASFITLIAAALCQGNRLIVIPSENFGKKEGFDMGDLFGNKSIFNKYENQETVNPFGDERYEVLQDYGIIDENWNLYDMNLGDK